MAALSSRRSYRRLGPLGIVLVILLVMGTLVPLHLSTGGSQADAARPLYTRASPFGLAAFLHDHPELAHRSVPLALLHEKLAGSGGEASGDLIHGPSQEAYDNRAYPATGIAPAQAAAARRAFVAIAARSNASRARARFGQAAGVSAQDSAAPGPWTALGPLVGTVPVTVTYTNSGSTVSGRIDSLAIAPTCVAGNCRLWVGTAGGGVWRTDDALATTPSWTSTSQGLGSNAIGSLLLDPTDPTSNTL